MSDRSLLDVTGRLANANGVLGVALARWDTRAHDRTHPDARMAAGTALEAIDGMLLELQLARARLVQEMRTSEKTAPVAVLTEREAGK